jgi:hypothetical protein
VTLSSTIVADNDSTGSEGDDLAEDPAAGDQFTIGFSLVEQDTDAVTIIENPVDSNKFGVDPQLSPLGENGGPTPSQILPLTSPAVDAGTGNGLATDQRGLTRTVDLPEVPNAPGSDGTDMGATEIQGDPPPPPSVDGAVFTAKRTQKVEGRQIKVKVKPGAAEAAKVFLSGDIKAGKKTYPLKGRKVSLAPGQTATVALKPKTKKVQEGEVEPERSLHGHRRQRGDEDRQGDAQGGEEEGEVGEAGRRAQPVASSSESPSPSSA